MDLVFDILKWSGLAAAGLAVGGMVLIGVMAWLLNHPVDDDDAKETPGRC